MRTRFELPDEHYLLVIDHDDDVQELLTVICEGRPTGVPTWSDKLDGGAS